MSVSLFFVFFVLYGFPEIRKSHKFLKIPETSEGNYVFIDFLFLL